MGIVLQLSLDPFPLGLGLSVGAGVGAEIPHNGDRLVIDPRRLRDFPIAPRRISLQLFRNSHPLLLIRQRHCSRAAMLIEGNNTFAHIRWFSPDEIATIVALDARTKKFADVKAVFPGAEISDVRTDRAHMAKGSER